MSVRPRAEDLALRRETGERRRALELDAQLFEPLLARLLDLIAGERRVLVHVGEQVEREVEGAALGDDGPP
jgi:hypothetical protein